MFLCIVWIIIKPFYVSFECSITYVFVVFCISIWILLFSKDFRFQYFLLNIAGLLFLNAGSKKVAILLFVCLFVCLLFAFILHFFNYLWHSPTVKLASHSTAHHFPPFSTHFLIHIFRSTFLLKLDSSDQTSSKHCVIMKYFDSLKLSLFFQTIGTKISAKS